MNEKNLLNRILLKLPDRFRLFRNNTGKGWVGKSSFNNGNVFIENARPLNAGLIKGSSDLIGWTKVTITPEMVGKEVAVFTAIEAKTGNQKPTKEQSNFITRVCENGGIAGIARTTDCPDTIYKTWLTI